MCACLTFKLWNLGGKLFCFQVKGDFTAVLEMGLYKWFVMLSGKKTVSINVFVNIYFKHEYIFYIYIFI